MFGNQLNNSYIGEINTPKIGQNTINRGNTKITNQGIFK